MIQRRLSKAVRIGSVTVGGDAPIVVQSMTKTDTRDAAATVRQVRELADCGCEIIRVAVPDMEAAQALADIKRASPIPVIADIHFDHRLALEALKAGVDGLRLNPGNIGGHDRVTRVVRAAKERSVPIRIGVNQGSLPVRQAQGKPKGQDMSLPVVERMVEAALEHIKLLEALDFDLIKVSLKSFDVPTTVAAYQLMAQCVPYPLHLGITEAGPPRSGAIRSAVGLGVLLYLGIGDTIRVSLSGPPAEEVFAGYEILKSLDLRQRGPTLVSCPGCGRSEMDINGLAQAVDKRLAGMGRTVKVAVMGCVVNGPGEARDADVGIACGKGRAALFRHGEVVRTIEEADVLEALMAEVERV